MPVKDIYHDCVKRTLIKDNWNITHDPFKLGTIPRYLYIDLQASQLKAVTKLLKKIVVELKSLMRRSNIDDFNYPVVTGINIFPSEILISAIVSL